jgi:hypothetical protein
LYKKHLGQVWCPYEKYTVDDGAEGQRLSYLDWMAKVYPGLKEQKDAVVKAADEKRNQREALVSAGQKPGKGNRKKLSEEVKEAEDDHSEED